MEEMREGMKEEIKKEIKEEMKEEISEITKQTIEKEKNDRENAMKSIEEKVDKTEKKLECAKDERDALNLDISTLREKFNKQAAEMREMKKRMSQCEENYQKVLSLSNFNQQYSQKNNIKVLKWSEKRDENLRSDFCEIVKSKTGQVVNPRDVLAIHRIPKNQDSRGPRPVIIKFINSESRVAVLEQRAKLKETFTMLDHLTPQNIDLINRLNNHPKVERAWYFNTRVYAYDTKGDRHKFDICDDIDYKLRHAPLSDQ
ncbi:hypothetical protein FSP39_021067 [Pinctada imbricata]|uniref:Uncharacterized protein n=1 Tax=Pinctada imbricata TaxID=66713 RepID=A0AA89BWB2_PINIB|nr:hypothetical protein FSP39_021067 [Pinctada imbricata]